MPRAGHHQSYDPDRRAVALCRALVAVLALSTGAACGPDDRLRETSKGRYDPQTGVLIEITFDKNKNGVIDTWTKMDGARPVSSTLDENEDGQIDRWEEYDTAGQLVRAGWIRVRSPKPGQAAPAAAAGDAQAPRVPDTWVYPSPDGRTSRVEHLDIDLDGRIVIARREFFDGDRLVRVEEDKDGDDKIDQWEVHENGVLKSVEFDEGTDGIPDRRFTYSPTGQLILIESDRDAAGQYTKRVVPGGR
jgi:hypothetical protein